MITPTQQTTQTNTPTASAAQSKTSGLASDFETFLLMLTAQARNQDPLEPLDSSEYASQLAQFSMVEQQVQTNDLLSDLALSLGSVNLEELASWVGMDVRAAAAFQFDGAPETLFAQAEPAATSAVMVIRDSDGTVIDRITAPTNETEFVWAGTASDGSPLPDGTYAATLESYDGDELLSEQLAATYHQVVEAQVGEDAVLLTLDSGQIVPAGTVTAVRTGT
ncbi:flagellar hook capping FlgD N-terminal domain-containing protein [Ruegeria meonggei]|uniref:Basal-body rod modification protein FlgD n=1 Tax=Ruegeria meonggei TaxID=1446476 RepID=A0A1X6ZRR8_9RHOB|nr:flagellar hook capping FlgD N-terminal domain-containing protein [Ruegeria meonggei]SLN59626.1 Basal-body rod modification protein FlgD [Ruegeria meonggei]